ncbi:double-strand break repair helicase AddA [Flavimaricola marinus]|uniref:DNA 3'-5' helicase n=1 Tax=Flavimaricola marinus TaxID=1819565 RepID=A0A238LBZ4_9RHOB|nr:double-strand break repair helicase AddA [Flavimaricola marinus]SMY07209.1 ATP-dependent helicase/nuclease subunit A [Flavimaricola marinus]
MIQRNDATLAQVLAADPRTSTWLSANAGSGKTRVLTDRVARLLFDEVEPQNILCLTYTKAAASEMQNRLFGRLGEWAMMSADQLRQQLLELGVEGDLTPDRLRRARTLFARAIETPGGLRIQTIHSFCAGLLRRFPLEAGVSPQFTEMEDRTAALLRADVADSIALDRKALITGVAAHMSGDDFDPLLQAIAGQREVFSRPLDEAALRDVLDLPPALTIDTLIDQTIGPDDLKMLHAIAALCAVGSSNDVKAAAKLQTLPKTGPLGADHLSLLEGVLLTGPKAKEPFSAKIGSFPTKATQSKAADLMDDLSDLMSRVEEARPLRLGLGALARTQALYAFATEFTARYDAAKLARGFLDYDDLILKARGLLLDPAVAQWVLFRLDGGIDHILVDEAQDTSPTQWDVIRSLTQEFTAGVGARTDRARTIFVVGDKKQSIYSFQGADPEGFDRMREHFRSALTEIDAPFEQRELLHSFRSAFDILRAVDQTFLGPQLDGLGPDAVRHEAFHEALPGRVDLWPPLMADDEDKDDGHWTEPVDKVSSDHEKVQLANHIAASIKRMIREETLPMPGKNGGPVTRRRITAGDFLILVRGRGEKQSVSIFAEVIRACKEAGLPIAGADRVRLGAELAVKDIVALLRFLALAEDDLSLACALRSPLFGWTEQQIYALAQPRKGYLWEALRDQADDHPDTMEILNDLRGKADFLRPYDLINRILTRHDGRRRLLARLGPESEDGIDALLSQALGYEKAEVPGLTGFLEWLGSGELDIKRQIGAAEDKIRVMTVHGAKGLEAPIVILPDTAKNRMDGQIRNVLYPADGQTIWAGPADDMPPAVQALKDDLKAAQMREIRRLLYVAMTRAETWLIVCAAGEVGDGDDSWHAMVSDGLAHTGHHEIACPTGIGQRLSDRDWNGGELVAVTAEPTDHSTTAPDPLGKILPTVVKPRTVSPSELGGAKVLPGDTPPEDEDDAKARGTLIHLLLEHLPNIGAQDRLTYGQQLVRSVEEAAGLSDLDTVITDTARLIDSPALAPIFAADALTEVDVTAQVSGFPARLHGAIDRLIVTDTTVQAIDYKSNRLVPDDPDKVPEGLLRQMGAYHAMLAEIWPDKQIDVAILWTATGQIMTLPPDLMIAALKRATLP